MPPLAQISPSLPMKPRELKPFSLAAALTLLGLAALSAQGDLNPPGIPQPTMRTLDQVEARIPLPPSLNAITISTAGSYYLTGDINVSGGNTGIEVDASNVHIDLNGFTIQGLTGGGTFAGIYIYPGITGISITNGFIRGGTTFNGSSYALAGFTHGIHCGAEDAMLKVSKVHISGVRNYGIYSNGAHVSVVDCDVEVAGNIGIQAFNVKNCQVRNASTAGIIAHTVVGSSVRGAFSTYGITSYSVSDSNCVNTNGSGYGIIADVVQNCRSISSGFAAITADSVLNSSAQGPTTGISAVSVANSRGIGTNGTGILADVVSNSSGTSTNGFGVSANVASFSYGSGASTGLSAIIANSCIGNPSVSATNKYNMP